MMIEAFSIPILLKAVDFLFEESRKILQERRERRQAQQEADTPEPEVTAQPAGNELKAVDVIQSRDVALSQKIDEAMWAASEAEIKHLLSLLEVHTQNYYLAKEQYAKWGSALVPPIIVNNLTEAENEIIATTKRLQAALSKVYGKKVTIPEIDQ
jgi:hypothetical protein